MVNSLTFKILVLEDQGLVRAGLRELIKISEPRAQIDEASSYKEAIDLLNRQFYDIAFLDIDLKAEKTGLDVLRYIRENEIDTRAIILSGNAEKKLVLECINAGACGYIPKDIDNDGIFRKALDTVFQGGIFIPATVFANGLPPSTAPRFPSVSPESIGVTGRSLEVLCYLCQGLPNKSIAKKMNIEEGTIRKDYVPKLFRIFKVTRRTELLIEVSRRGIKLP